MEILIDEITAAALEAIDLAAGEAARAAFLASLEREAVMARENLRLRLEMETLRRNSLFIGVICFVSGLFAGVTGTLIIGGR